LPAFALWVRTKRIISLSHWPGAAQAINASLAAFGTHDPLLAQRDALEAAHIARVSDDIARSTWLAPWTPDTKQGAAAETARLLAAR
jgi:hypothetical protein